MEPLVKALLSYGVNVKLLHDATETSWEDVKEHGMVILKTAAGAELARKEGFQHNRNLRRGGAWDDEAVKNLVDEVTKTATAASA